MANNYSEIIIRGDYEITTERPVKKHLKVDTPIYKGKDEYSGEVKYYIVS